MIFTLGFNGGLDGLCEKYTAAACWTGLSQRSNGKIKGCVSCCTCELYCVLRIESRIQCAHWDRCSRVIYDSSPFYLSFIRSKLMATLWQVSHDGIINRSSFFSFRNINYSYLYIVILDYMHVMDRPCLGTFFFRW